MVRLCHHEHPQTHLEGRPKIGAPFVFYDQKFPIFAAKRDEEMEILDLYDKDLKNAGMIIERGQPIPKGYLIPIVAVYIYNDKGEYLIQKVAKTKGNYYATTAGHVRSGETDFALAMLRELEEELGIAAKKEDLKLVKVRRYEYKFTMLYMLKSNANIEDLRLQEEEVDSAYWMTRNDIELLVGAGFFNRIHYQLLLDCEERLHLR